MSKNSTQNTPDVSGETSNAGDVEAMIGNVNAFDENDDTDLPLVGFTGETRHARSAVKVIYKYDMKCVYTEIAGLTKFVVTMPTDSDSDCSKGDSQDVSTDSESDAEEDVQDVCKKGEEQCLSQLHLAAKQGDTEAVRSLLMSSAKVDVLDTEHNTPLHIATLNGHEDVVNLLLSKNASVESRNALGQTSLHLAAKIGHLAIAQLLLKSNGDVNAVCKRQATPLHLAAKRGHKETVENLIYNGANVNACNNVKMTPLHLACKNGHTSIVEMLLDNHAAVDVWKQSQETPFYLAAKKGHAEITDLLLRRDVYDFLDNDFIDSPLIVAVEKGHTKVVEVILKHSRTSGKLTKDGLRFKQNAMSLVEARGVFPAELLKKGGRRLFAEIVWREENIPFELREDGNECNALELAGNSVEPEMVRLLLSGDHCVFSEEDLHNCFRLMIDSIKHFLKKDPSDHEQYTKKLIEFAQALINSSKFNVNHQGSGMYELNTLLHEVIEHCKYSSEWRHLHIQIINDVIQLLLEKGADFNLKNSFGETPLIVASEKGRCDAIQILFDWEQKSGMKLDIDARDQYGETALIKATVRHDVSVMRLLLNHNASVNLCDYYGFTALHAAIYEPNRNWFDFYFFCKEILELTSSDMLTWEKETVDPNTVIDTPQSQLEHDRAITPIKEEVVKLLLANEETNVNAIDFRGNTPLDLAVKSSWQINSATFEALENRGAIRKLEAPEDESLIDEGGRNPLHRLIISLISNHAIEDKKAARGVFDCKKFELMVDVILLRPTDFMESATATDDKGRTPLHYAVMPPRYEIVRVRNLVNVFRELGCNVNAADMYGKTPLHYAEIDDQYELLVQYGADENAKDKHGHTPKDLKQLRESLTINEKDRKKLPIGKKALYLSEDFAEVLETRPRLIETIRIFSQTHRPKESSEESIWKIWTENEFIRLNRRLNQLKPLIHRFIERLAVGIKEKDWRFECQPILVGSAEEETKAVISGDFDYNFKLIKFSQLCEAFPHQLGLKGYFQLRQKTNDEKFAVFFDSDQCLLTNEINSRFQILMEEVLKDPNFWQEEHRFEWNLAAIIDKSESEKPPGLCTTLQLRMIHPFKYKKGGFLFINISMDIVACVQVENCWPDNPPPVGISRSEKLNGCTFVFDQPRVDPFKPDAARFLLSDTFARISFAPLESRFIKESSTLIKAAYIVCKMILYSRLSTNDTYRLKTCLLFCMEALSAKSGSKTRNKNEITPEQLEFWVERIMFCFMEFSRHRVHPCYFMPSFRQQVRGQALTLFDETSETTELFDGGFFLPNTVRIPYKEVYALYLDLCPDGTTIDIPIDEEGYNADGNRITNHDPIWKHSDREEFIRKLASRSPVFATDNRRPNCCVML